MLMLNKTPAAATSSVIALLLARANRALVRFRMTSSNRENGFVGLAVVDGFVGLAVVADPAPPEEPAGGPSIKSSGLGGQFVGGLF